MNARERVASAIEHRKTDRIPTGEITLADPFVKTFLHVDQVAYPQRLDIVKRLGIDAVCLCPEWTSPSSRLPHSTEAQWNDFSLWTNQTDRFVFAMLDGVFGWGTRLMGFQGFLATSVKRSQTLVDLIHGVERLNVSLARQAADKGADGILVADDIAYQHGTTVSPKYLRDTFFPSLERQLSGMASLKLPVFFHSDGNLNAVMEDLVQIGFHGFQCLESHAGMDLARLKATYGKKVCLWGSFDPKDLFLARSSGELEKRVQDLVRTGSRGGGYIFGTSSGLVEGMRPKNVETVYLAVKSRALPSLSPSKS